MSKERLLTILIPIKDSDCEATEYDSLAALVSAVTPSEANIDKIYKVTGGYYYRSTKGVGGTYSYLSVTDREFPYLGKPLEIYDFTYDATRMGAAPTISAQNVMWYAEKDGNGEDVTLDGLWTSKCHVRFNGEDFNIKQIPTSSKSNEDARYKYDIDFVSERVILEQVYLYDIVSPFVTEKPISESSKFSFYGDINELAKRINASLIRSGLSSLTRKYVNYPNRTETVPYLSYEQWNQINVNPQPLVGTVFANVGELNYFRATIYTALSADYNSYLMQYIYANDNGVYTLAGYQCVIGKDKKGEMSASEEKLIPFDNSYIHDALQQFKDVFETEYYIVKEKDQQGVFTGNTLIVVGDCEHDFADWDEENDDYARDSDGIPTTENPFDYGVDEELLSKEKTNTTDKIVTRITGVGSTDNIPWYYPNPNPDGWIKPTFKRDGVEVPQIEIDYPSSEGTTVADSVRFERFLKNRIGNSIKYGRIVDSKNTAQSSKVTTSAGSVSMDFKFDTHSVTRPRLTFSLSYPLLSNCTSYKVELFRVGATSHTDTYDSTQTYENPTEFQEMCRKHDGSGFTALLSNREYMVRTTFYVADMPSAGKADYEGYRYASATVNFDGDPEQWEVAGLANEYELVPAHIGENFYEAQGLTAYADGWHDIGSQIQDTFYHKIVPTWCGYSTNGESSGSVAPLSRFKGKTYKDIQYGNLYRCTTNQSTNILTGEPSSAFNPNPQMEWDEWIETFLTMKIALHKSDGWYIGNDMVELEDYGLGEPMQGGSAYSADIGDAIEFKRTKWVTPQQNLMPEVYVKTDGERRFYNAHNYWDKENSTLYTGVADTMIGEVQVQGTKVRNPIYKENETDQDSKHYDFENEYVQSLPHEHIENFDDEKPTITGQRNHIKVSPTEAQFNASKTSFFTYDEGEYVQCTESSVYDSDEQYYALLRIDVVEEFAYDATDNDEVWESNDGGNYSGEYKHPYFFARLRPMGFNIFDLALQEDMVVSMTTGHCGACNFKIGVDENSKKNPVQVWQYDVYKGDWASRVLKYEKGTLRRYVDITDLYYDTDGTENGYVQVKSNLGVVGDVGPISNMASSIPVFWSYVYSEETVANGEVGSVRQDNKTHFEGDVVTSGRYMESQQDTSEEYVWVALMKDTDTYGTIMPSARPNYTNHDFDIYIRPSSVSDVHVDEDVEHGIAESTYTEDEENADKFVLTNIRLPQMYLRRAERSLSRRLVAYMYDNNYQKFNFSIRFSRIYIEENPSTDENLNENSVLYVRFNGRTYRQYVKHYTYRMSHDSPLPETSVDMNEELSVSRTVVERWNEGRKKDLYKVTTMVAVSAQQLQDRSAKKDAVEKEQAVATVTRVERDVTVKALEWGEF